MIVFLGYGLEPAEGRVPFFAVSQTIGLARFLLLHFPFSPVQARHPRIHTPNLLHHQPTYPSLHTSWGHSLHVTLPNPTLLTSPPKKKGHFPFFFSGQKICFYRQSKWKLYSLFMSQLGLLISLLVWDNRSIPRVIKKIKFRRVVKERES